MVRHCRVAVSLRNIKDEQGKFDLVINALPKECLRTVLDLVTNPPEEDA